MEETDVRRAKQNNASIMSCVKNLITDLCVVEGHD